MFEKQFARNYTQANLVLAENLRSEIVNNKPATISYAAPKPQEVLDEDKVILTLPILVKQRTLRLRQSEEFSSSLGRKSAIQSEDENSQRKNSSPIF